MEKLTAVGDAALADLGKVRDATEAQCALAVMQQRINEFYRGNATDGRRSDRPRRQWAPLVAEATRKLAKAQS